MPRKRSSKFIFYDVPDAGEVLENPRPPSPTTHRHTEYSSHNGHVTASTTYYCVDVGHPSKKSRITHDSEDFPHSSAELDLDTHDFFEDMAAEGADSQYFLEALDDDFHAPRRRTAGDHPLREWISEIPTYLDELIRLEGRCGMTTDLCAKCDAAGVLYRCEDCHDLSLYCGDCTQRCHTRNPLHRIYKWVKTHFRRAVLRDVGVRIQLGHPLGVHCACPMRAANDFIIIDVGGIHEVALDFCGCETAEAKTTQLLRSRLMPATSVYPKSAATFRVLESFHLLSNQSKVSAFEYYNTLARHTCNTGINPPKDRYVTFLRLIRMWRHLKLLKRSGRGHDPAGVEATMEGSCAVLCPACPHPGKNLPDDWESTLPSKRWLYSLFVGLDANFRMKRKKVSSDKADPGLNHGCAYFVETKKYQQFIEEFSDLQFEETMAHMKGSHGTAASGIGCVECTRHDMKRPCSIGDLQKGERIPPVLVLFHTTLHANGPAIFGTVSHNTSPTFDWRHDTITFLIPKFHLPAHQGSCQTSYSFNLTINVGRTDGEAVERGWAAVNPFASSTKEMGPGARRDILDDVFGDYNWRKVCLLPKSLLSKIKEAVDERNEQMVSFQEFNAALPSESTALWKQAVEDWEGDPRKPNPFVATQPSITLASARLRLAEEEAVAMAAGQSMTVHDKASSSYMVAAGIEFEEQQRRLRSDVASLGQHATDLQRAKVQERRNMLQRQLDGWSEIQQLYMPGVIPLRGRVTSSQGAAPILAENYPLLLPSAAVSHITCDPRLLEHEWQLRYGQAHENLDDLRRHLRLRTHMYKYKDRFIRGQRENTRARTTIAAVEAKVSADASRYRMAYAALEALAPPLLKTGWRVAIRPLCPEDVKGFEEDANISRDRVKLSWIWKTPRMGCADTAMAGGEDINTDESEGTQEALRIEWCKARARAARWWEECRLLREEMRRVMAFHAYQGMWWEEQVDRREDIDSDLAEGLFSYAYRQAEIRRDMQEFCRKTWAGVQEYTRIADAMIGVEDDSVMPL
ncbi:hypothetical protein A0H81_11116 [Grifola frondosa]|uniref:CxC2-like cysteine cluster KDZ transposase-associated domain-containing protein n=1 Tax=Grifola frondosa TaxID=5627 RepID=A0A1C7LVE4_GRIFR|nr:hypothetical protein A0H81_11116 [Grifola frondosa]